MRYFSLLIVATFITIFLSGCSEKYEEIKQAAAGISSKANEATTAISADVHAIRATEITYAEQSFTINDVFKTILRDVQWFYDESTNQLKITGTWKDNGLFAEKQFDEETKKQLVQEGEVEVLLTIDPHQLSEQQTAVTLSLHNHLLVNETGNAILYHLYDVYIAQ